MEQRQGSQPGPVVRGSVRKAREAGMTGGVRGGSAGVRPERQWEARRPKGPE